MAHNILGTKFLSVREPAWHGIGKSYAGPMTAAQAVEESGAAEVVIDTRRMGFQSLDGTFTPVDDRVVIVRKPIAADPNEVILGTAGAGYTLLQNTELGEALDRSGLTTRYPVETCGVLGKGETIFICLNMGPDTIAGEDHNRYALMTDKRDGASALMVLTTFTRVVCQNTLNIALGRGEVRINLMHGGNLATDFQFSLDVIDQVETSSIHVKEALTALYALKVKKEQLADIWDATYPVPAMGTLLKQYSQVDDPTKFDPATLARLSKMQERYQYETTWRGEFKALAAERYDVLCQTAPSLAGTGLGVLNAVAELADHTRNGRTSTTAVLGWRADEKIRAYEALLRLGEGASPKRGRPAKATAN